MKQIRRFFEKQGFFILLAVCVGVIVASGLWAMSMRENGVGELPADASSAYAQRLEDAERMKMIRPVRGEILRSYSAIAWHPDLACWCAHEAVDIAAEKGAYVYAAKEGKVSAAFLDKRWGGVMELTHAQGLMTRYRGLTWPLPVKVGESIAAQQVVGTVGVAEVEAVDGPHLHFEASVNGVPLDVTPLIVEE